MRNILRYIVCACLALALGSCIKDELTDNTFCRDAELRLSIGVNGTRAVGTNDDDTEEATILLNEDRIDNYEVFLFKSDENHKPTGNALFSSYVQNVDANESTTAEGITVPAGALNELFANGATSCNIYVVANVGESLATKLATTNTALTLANLKAHIVTANFHETKEIDDSVTLDPGNWGLFSNLPQANFVMDSEGSDTVTKSGNNLSGSVLVTRAASKISFTAYIGKTMTIDDKTWTPKLDNVTINFHNTVNKGAIDNGSDTDDTFTMPTGDGIYADVTGVQLTSEDFGGSFDDMGDFEGSVEGVSEWQQLKLVVPFYTYSNIWSADERNTDPSIVLTVPWYVKGEESTTLTSYNYTIPLTSADGDLKLVRNKHYNIALRVGVLGDLDELAESEFSYEVLDWVGNDITVDLADPTYLVVEKDYVEMNNLESYTVDFAASDTVEAKIVKVVKPIVSTEVPSYPEYTTANAWNALNNNNFTITTDNENKTITLNHELDNDPDSDYYDYVPYEIYVEVTMTVDNVTFKEEIKFVQYPAFYIIADTNDDFDFEQYEEDDNTVGNDSSSAHNDYYGGLFINGNQNNSRANYGGAYYLGAATNRNPNMYVINVSALDSDSEYVLGDPRTRDVNNLSFTSADAAHMYKSGTNNNLSYYYPTDGSASTESMIAPKFRVASSYGVTGDGSYANMQRRCATYQEDGYPAGRWRIPTAAEIRYIVKLSAAGFIPKLFNDNDDNPAGDYFCAHGIAYPKSDGTVDIVDFDNSPHAVRCVYDEWYWNDTCNKTTFTWGDQAR